MAYTLTKSDGNTLLVLNDGVVDQSYTSLNFIGKNVSNFGDAQNENFLHLLENFNSKIEPTAPIQGQIWFDSNDHILRPMAYDGDSWRPLAVSVYNYTATDISNAGGKAISACRPGDFWFDSVRQQLHVVTSGTTVATQTVMIGPESVPNAGTTKLSSVAMRDSLSFSHPVIQVIVDGEVIGVLSNASFTADGNGASIGFPRIFRGLTLKNYSTSTVQSTSAEDVTMHGILDHLTANYTKRDVAEHIQSNWVIDSNYGMKLGSVEQGAISWNAGANGVLVESLGVVKLQSSTGSLVFDGTSLVASATGTGLGTSTIPFSSAYVSRLNPGSGSYGTVEGNWRLDLDSTISPLSDLHATLGNSTHRFNTVYTKNVNGGSGQSSLTGLWYLTTGSTFIPQSDMSNSLGSYNNRFLTVYTKSISANEQPIDVYGAISSRGNIDPYDSNLYNIGSTSSQWNSIYVNSISATEETVDTLNASQVTVNTLDAAQATLSDATISRIIDGFANAVTKFDTDVNLAANEHGFVSTQRAVKTYVDNTKDYIIGLIDSVRADLAGQISNIKTVPSGAVMYVAMLDVPVGYLLCNGAPLSTATYPSLFAAIGYMYGGSGSTFNLPDLRGQFIRGWDAGRGLDPSRGFGSSQADDNKSHKHGITLSHEQGGSHDQNGFPQTDWTGGMVHHSAAQPDASWCYPNGAGNPMSSTGGSESRPKNVALLPIIKT